MRPLGRRLQRATGLSTAEYEVLVNLDKAPCGELRVLELAAAMEWEKSRLSKQIGRMVDRGLVARQPCPTDQRGALLALTGAGRDAFVAAEQVHLEHVRELFFDALEPDELVALGDIAAKVLAHVEAADAPA